MGAGDEEEDLKFEADLLMFPKWPKNSQYFLFLLLCFSFFGFVINGIYSASTGLVSDTLIFFLGTIGVCLILFFVFAMRFGIAHKVSGKLFLDKKQVVINDLRIPTGSVQKIAFTFLSHKGEKYNSDASDGDGVNFVTIDYAGKQEVYSFLLKSAGMRNSLYNVIHHINNAHNSGIIEIEQPGIFSSLRKAITPPWKQQATLKYYSD